MDKPLTQNIGPGKTTPNFNHYKELGGYTGLLKALSMSADSVLEIIKDSNLRGRGGAGFPTGMKWSFVPRGPEVPQPKYVVANADEMEPGTFKDRLLMEGDPHQLIEGMAIAAYTIGANIGYIFLRGEYTEAAEKLTLAIKECYENGYLGNNIADSKFCFDLHLHTSAGRYICGEETALINALEGKRANPRAKPPFPQVSGLFGKPTVVNNVETYCNVPHILEHGVEWYQSLGLGDNGGTKLFGVSGRVKSPGAWELPMGTPIREIIEDYAGGMANGYELRAFLPGGASTDFLTCEHLDLPMDYESIQKAGSRMGTGTMIVLDDKTCPIGMMLNLERFFAQESCGWCTPCRDGLPWTAQILDDIEHGRGEIEDLDTLQMHTKFMWVGNTFCALGPGAVEPLQSGLKIFRDEFEQHISTGCCPYH